MPVLWSYALMTILFGYGTAILINIFSHWNDSDKKPFRTNEVLYSLLYFIFGISSLFLFANDGLTLEFENFLYMLLVIASVSIDLFWWVGNFIPNILYSRKHPEVLKERNMTVFADYIRSNHVDTISRDISRKSLHLLLMGIVIGLYLYARSNEGTIELFWENYWSYCKFIYTLIGLAFCNMFTLGDLVRTNRYHWIPGWARKWYSTTISPRELYTFISSIPYVLSLAILMLAPIQVIFIATVVSAIGDGVASIFGKSFGKHKFPAFLDKKKSFEGLLAGMTASFVSTVAVLVAFPVLGQDSLLILAIGTASMVLFASIDLFVRNIADNILNVLLPGIAAWLLLLPLL